MVSEVSFIAMAKTSPHKEPHKATGRLQSVSDYLPDKAPSHWARLRRAIRNPSMLTAVLMALLVIAIPAGVLGPRILTRGIEGYQESQRRQERQFVNVTAASWIYPWLRRNAENMRDANRPIEWRAVSFANHGPCNAKNLSQLPVGKYSFAVSSACNELDRIQLQYAADCALPGQCSVPEEAREGLQIVLDRLRVGFSDAGLVDDYDNPAAEEQ